MTQEDNTAGFLWSLLGLLCEIVMKLDEDDISAMTGESS